MTWSERRRAKKLRRIKDRRDDLVEYLYKWSFGMAPSERRRMHERIDKLDSQIEETGADDD